MSDKNEWSQLPLEVREMVVQRSTESTRINLKACSSSSKELVENTPLKTIAKCRLGFCSWYYIQKWTIKYTRERYDYPTKFEYKMYYDTFDEFQEAVYKFIKSVKCIKQLRIDKMKSEVPLRFKTGEDQLRILVESLVFEVNSDDQLVNILSQLEPIYLRKIRFDQDWKNSAIYDMPQVLLAENIDMYSSSALREDQLMKLRPKRLILKDIHFSIDNFVRRCIREADENCIEFEIHRYHGKLRWKKPASGRKYMRTPNLKLQLELYFGDDYIAGKIIYRKSVSQMVICEGIKFNVAQDVRICDMFYGPGYELKIARKHQPSSYFKSEDRLECQDKMNEVFGSLDYIRRLCFCLQNEDEIFRMMKSDEPLAVGFLDIIENKGCAYDLVQVCDPNLLRKLIIQSRGSQHELYDLPQVQNVNCLSVRNSFPDDDQLQLLNATLFHCGEHSYWKNKETTAVGINGLLKKCVRNLKEKRYSMRFYALYNPMKPSVLFKGLEIISTTEIGGLKHTIIDSPFPEYVLLVGVGNRFLAIERHLRNTEIPRTYWSVDPMIIYMDVCLE